MLFLDLRQEKDHENLIHNLEEFDPTNLHHTSTKERKILPDTNSEFTHVVSLFVVFPFISVPLF